jgi:hypothetical protein
MRVDVRVTPAPSRDRSLTLLAASFGNRGDLRLAGRLSMDQDEAHRGSLMRSRETSQAPSCKLIREADAACRNQHRSWDLNEPARERLPPSAACATLVCWKCCCVSHANIQRRCGTLPSDPTTRTLRCRSLCVVQLASPRRLIQVGRRSAALVGGSRHRVFARGPIHSPLSRQCRGVSCTGRSGNS